MTDDLSGLGPFGFERLCLALAVHVLGPGLQVFGEGPDGGREATFDSKVGYPSADAPWHGFGVLQAKYKNKPLGTGADTTWLLGRVKAELEAWANPESRRVRDGRRPQYLIFATNVALSAVPGRGGKDRVDRLIKEHAEAIGLKGWGVWDAGQLTTFLDTYPDVRRSFAALITPNEVLAAMHDKLTRPTETTITVTAPTSTIRPGQPGQEAAFRPAYMAAGGLTRLGNALGEVYQDTPGWVQHFEGPPGGEPVVICALFGQPAVAVVSEVWNALSSVGSGVTGGGITGVGLPIAGQPGSPLINTEPGIIELAGGAWGRSGRGRLIKRGPDGWKWEPQADFDSEAISDRDTWTSRDDDMDLRLRVAARIPILRDQLRVTGAGRTRMLHAISATGIMPLIDALAERYSLEVAGQHWEETPEPDGYNNSLFAAYHHSAYGVGDRAAMKSHLRFSLPSGYSSGLHSALDLRISFDALRSAAGSGNPAAISAEDRLALSDLIEFYVHGWEITTTILPLLVTAEPLDSRPAGAPRLELHISNERPEFSGKSRTVRTLDMVDLSAFGRTRKAQIQDMSVGVTTPLGLDRAAVTQLVRQAVTRMAEDFAFTDVDSAIF